jgi:hypothetical protein
LYLRVETPFDLISEYKESCNDVQKNPYDKLIEQIDQVQSTVLLFSHISQLLPVEMHKLLIHVLAQAEQIGRDGCTHSKGRR